MSEVRSSVDIKRLKRFALRELPVNSPLRQLILSENEKMEASEFIHKMDVWLRLVEFEN